MYVVCFGFVLCGESCQGRVVHPIVLGSSDCTQKHGFEHFRRRAAMSECFRRRAATSEFELVVIMYVLIQSYMF